MTTQRSRPSVRTWLLAALELAAVVLVARLMVQATQTPASVPAGDHDHGMTGMPSMSNAAVPAAQWSWVEYTAIGVSAVALAWWLIRRQSVAAVLAAASLVALATSPAVRVLATQSHLIAMVALELLLVIAPLLMLAAERPRPEGSSGGPSRPATVVTVTAALLYAGLLIVVHLPAIHSRSAELGSVPVWVPPIALVIGVTYWSGVLRTAGRVPRRIRRAALLGAQEVAALIGLLSLFGAWGAMTHPSPLGISMAWDQRIGGIIMMATCAAVGIPIARKIS
jgi:hypothetical protein